MATKQTTIDLILGHLAAAGDVSARKMFGDYGLFLRGRMIAIVGLNTVNSSGLAWPKTMFSPRP